MPHFNNTFATIANHNLIEVTDISSSIVMNNLLKYSSTAKAMFNIIEYSNCFYKIFLEEELLLAKFSHKSNILDDRMIHLVYFLSAISRNATIIKA
jgi:hypothetical protein